MSCAREVRIEIFAKLMRTLEFKTGITVREHAAKWKMALSTAQELAVIASKRVRAEVTDPDRIHAKVSIVLEETIDKARLEGDHASVIAAAKTWATLSAPVTGPVDSMKAIDDASIRRAIEAGKVRDGQA